MLTVTPIPAFRDNYIWMIRRDDDPRVVVVDPGEPGPVEDRLHREGLELAGILITHHHPDHVGGVRDLIAGRDIPVHTPARENVAGSTRALHDGDRFTVEPLDASFEVIDIPGHTSGHIAYFGEGLLFSGDTLFAVGCGKLFEGTAAQMQASLARLRALPEDTRIYCGHEYTVNNIRFARAVEPDNEALEARQREAQGLRDAGEPTLPSTIGAERETNPFLRWDDPSVIAAASRQAGRELSDPVSVFAELRAWKDRF